MLKGLTVKQLEAFEDTSILSEFAEDDFKYMSNDVLNHFIAMGYESRIPLYVRDALEFDMKFFSYLSTTPS
jgi:hypothetical protein